MRKTVVFILYSIFFSGGLALQGNPWRCSCENTWLGSWLRRWMRETLQLHTSVAERGQTIQSIVRTITCYDPDNVLKSTPMVSLDKNVKCYDKQKVNAALGLSLSTPLLGLASLIFLLWR